MWVIIAKYVILPIAALALVILMGILITSFIMYRRHQPTTMNEQIGILLGEYIWPAIKTLWEKHKARSLVKDQLDPSRIERRRRRKESALIFQVFSGLAAFLLMIIFGCISLSRSFSPDFSDIFLLVAGFFGMYAFVMGTTIALKSANEADRQLREYKKALDEAGEQSKISP